MWRSSSCSRSLVRSLLGGSQRRKGASIALAFLSSSSSLYLAAGGVGGGSAAGSITFVDETKQKLERDGQEVTGYPQLLERTGFGRFRDDAVACRILHGAGAVLLFRTTISSRPSKVTLLSSSLVASSYICFYFESVLFLILDIK
ncbi:hypothetical protein BHE74_00022386 [Ensete ventricosum]|nr:hypothetical protein BHE74_00022386 [Ensete ventricosum]